MTSPYERPDREPIEELERLLHGVEEELAGWRARAGKPAEAAPKSRGSLGVADLSQARQRLALLEGENQLLRQRIAAAREQVEQLRSRLRFIEDRGTDAA